jgi:hypothetical protein
MRTTRALFVATIVAATIAAPLGGIARAQTAAVVVALRVRLGFGDAVGHTTNECRVKVPRSANGIAVLKAAERAGCIDSYVLTRDEEGTRAGCINGLCEMRDLDPTDIPMNPYATWDIYYPGSYHYRQRLEGFRAGSAKTLMFHYVPCSGGC